MIKVDVGREITLLPVTADQEDLVFEIFKDCRVYLVWQNFNNAEEKEYFLKQQFNIEHSQYLSIYPEASYYFICFENEVIGRLFYSLGKTELRILDIGILSPHRSSGIGKKVIRYLIWLSETEKKPISLHVSWFNQSAFNFYQSLGFVVTSSTGIGYEMKYSMPT